MAAVRHLGFMKFNFLMLAAVKILIETQTVAEISQFL